MLAHLLLIVIAWLIAALPAAILIGQVIHTGGEE